MPGFVVNIEKLTQDNTDYRRVLFTAPNSQLVLMSLAPEVEIGSEVHPNNDQFFRVESGVGQVVIDDESFDIADGSAVVVPAGAWHNVINSSGTTSLQLYTIYAPAHHPDGTIHKTKAEATEIE